MDTKRLKDIKQIIHGKKERHAWDGLETHYEPFKIGLFLQNAREEKKM